MNKEIFLSTGAIVEKRNNYDKDSIKRIIPPLIDKNICDGAELMMINPYYTSLEKNISGFLSEGVNFPVTHCDKEVGTILSNAAVIRTDSKKESDRLEINALDLFKQNITAAKCAGSKRMVLHLWGGLSSDYAVEYNIDKLSELIEISENNGIKLLIENVPSAKEDPLANLKKINSRCLERTGVVYDTRFAECHKQHKETLSDRYISHYIEHVHISDYIGGKKEFSHLRPVYHPGEGIIDFQNVFSLLKKINYCGTFTLESQGITSEVEINVNALINSLTFIRNNAENI